jgi:7-carboxy-7-deazaguanine synthase
MTIREIIETIQQFDCRLVEITGGEPLCQAETPSLAAALIDSGYSVLVETNGSIDIRQLPDDCIKIMDIKCPSSNEAEKNFPGNILFLGTKDQIKFVIGDSEDYCFARDIVKNHCMNLPRGNILFSVNTEVLEPQELAAWILKDGLDARLHMQLHKIIWPEIERGV